MCKLLCLKNNKNDKMSHRLPEVICNKYKKQKINRNKIQSKRERLWIDTENEILVNNKLMKTCWTSQENREKM